MNGIYFSGTGNTKYCMEEFAKSTGDRAVRIASEAATATLRDSDDLALGYPVYFSDIPYAGLYCRCKIA